MNKKIYHSHEFHKIHKIFTNSFQTEFILHFPSRNLRNSRYTRNFRWKISSIETHRNETLKPNISSLVVSRRCNFLSAFSISVLLSAFPRCTLSRHVKGDMARLRFIFVARKFPPPTIQAFWINLTRLLRAFNNSFGRNLARDATMPFLNQWME